MALSDEQVRGYMKRLLVSRMRILCNHGFYGLLLMKMIYAIDETAETAYTDGERIAFAPKFLEALSDDELDFVMMHEVLHVVLRHCLRGEKLDNERYNIAADIVVNSNIMLENGGNLSSITLSKYGPSMHVAPDGKEGHLYTAEEVYQMLPASAQKKKKTVPIPGDEFSGKKGKSGGKEEKNGNSWDDHSSWGKFAEDSVMRDVWVKNFDEVCEAISIRNAAKGCGTLPLFAKRLLEKLRKPQTDWRTILNDFIQEEVNDYSFSPPDRRFQDSPFFLPDFNEMGQTDEVHDILFMIDTSGSMSDKQITAAYSEIKGAIDQFDGKLRGWLGFFDAAIIEPKPFASLDEFLVIRPAGGGGTDFHVVFKYVEKHMEEPPPRQYHHLNRRLRSVPQRRACKRHPRAVAAQQRGDNTSVGKNRANHGISTKNVT